MKKVAFIFLILIASTFLAETYALIIGSGSFDDKTIIPLPDAIKDAKAFKKAVVSLGIAKDKNITFLENPTYGEMKRSILLWARLAKSPDDKLIFYYSGHGYSKDGKAYIIPKDVDSTFIEDTAINFTEILKRLKSVVKTRNVVIIMDACYSGSLAKDRPLKFKRYEKVSLESLSESYAFLLSSKGDQTSQEREEGGGWFTYYLIKGIQGQANKNGDDTISLKELYDYLKEKVEDATNGKQTPILLASADIIVAKDMSTIYKNILAEITSLWTQGNLSEQLFKLYAKILNQPAEKDTKEEAKIREYLVKYYRGAIDLQGLVAITKGLGVVNETQEKPQMEKPVESEEKYEEKGTAYLKLIPSNDLAKGAKVYIDGKYAGKIEGDMFSIEVEAGKHKVLITNEKIDDMEFEIEVGEYEIYKKEIVAKPATRVIKIITNPSGAKVYKDGEYIDKSPTFLKVEVGKTFHIKLTKEGYEEREYDIYIPSKGNVMEKEYTLIPKKTTLKIYTNPEGAFVYLNGKYQGISPLTIEKSEQPIKGTIKITKKGYEEESIDVYVKARKEKIINETLKKIILLDIKTVPSGAKVYIDDNYIGETPLYKKVATKEGLLVIKKARYEVVKKQIPLWQDRVSLSFSLKKSAPPIIWQKALGGSKNDVAYSIQQTSDGGFIVAGGTRSNDGDVGGWHWGYGVYAPYSDYWVVKLDSSGNIEWQKALGGSKDDGAYSIQQTNDGGYIVAGWTYSNDWDVGGWHRGYNNSFGFVLPYSDYWIVKLGRNGNIQWQKALGGSGEDVAYSIQQTRHGWGYIVAGYTKSNNGDVSGNHGKEDFWVVKLDGNGNIQWQKALGGSGEDVAYSVQQTSDGGFIIAGWTKSNDGDVSGNHGDGDAWIVKLDENGNIQWQRALGGSRNDEARSIQQTSDGGFIVAGLTKSNDGDVSGWHEGYGKYGPYSDYWIVKLDRDGNTEWQKALGGSDDDWALSIKQTSDGGYIVAGYTKSNDGDVSGYHGDYDAWIVKLDSSGNIQWQKALGGSDDDRAYSIQQTRDGGYIVAGRTESNDGDVNGWHKGHDIVGCTADFWIVKLGW